MAKERTFLNFLLFSGVLLLPVYIFSSGSLQPSHLALLIFSLASIVMYGFRLESWSVAMLCLALYATILETGYVLGGAETWSLLTPMYLGYNFLLTYAVWQYCRHNGVEPLARGLIVAAFIGLASIGVFGVELNEGRNGIRASGGFNNPNQLGYFAVCLLSLAYVLNRRGVYNTLWTYALYGVAVFLSIASLSKAAMVATFAVVFIASNPKLKRSFIVPWLIAIVIALAALFMLQGSGALDQYLFTQRLSNMGAEGDSNLESRGYFVFLEVDAITAFMGLGTDKVATILKHEVHSTIASIFNLYGVFGLALFLTVLVIWTRAVRRNFGWLGVVCIVLPSMLYGITHNGSRFSIFWLLFAVSMLPLKAATPAGSTAVGAPRPLPTRYPAASFRAQQAQLFGRSGGRGSGRNN